MKDSRNKGFSLVELIIVIVIMAVLIAFLIPQFVRQVEKSKEARDLQDVEEYKVAIESMIMEDALPSGRIYINVNPEENENMIEVRVGRGASANPIPDAILENYGIDGEAELASKHWSSFSWMYDPNNYTWRQIGDTSGATYYTPTGKSKLSE
jgi:type IV pilus assembly protein PilA